MKRGITVWLPVAMACLLVMARLAAAEPVAGQKDAVLKEVKDIYVCLQNNLYISEAEATGALCPDGAKVIRWVERMVKDKWDKAEIIDLVKSLKMGKPLVEKNSQPACAAKGKLKLEAFIMSYCPYGVRFFTDTLQPMIAELGNAVEYVPRFILQKDPSGNLVSMHGQKEVDEDLRMICLRDKWGKETWAKYMACFSMEIFGNQQAPKDWQFCAKQAGVEVKDLEACFSTQAAKLAEKDMELSQKYGAFASPTSVYNCDSNIVGAIPFANVKPSLCRLIPEPKPAQCKK